jgi:DNA-binding transcriptional LysR family regulator
VNIQNIDLNLLLVFDAVWRFKNVSRAAEVVGLSQPAVSNALRRLRLQFHDRLFVRTAEGMQPTPLAAELGPIIVEALGRIDAGLRRRRDFNPAEETRAFTLIMTDIGEVVFLPPLLDLCKREAPGVSFRTVQLSTADTPRALQSGEVDLAIGFVPDLSGGVYQQRLFQTEYVCMVRTAHPAIGERLSRRQFMEANHALAEAQGTGHYVVERRLAELGLMPRIGLRVPHFLALPMIIAASDMVATIPRPLGIAFRRNTAIRLLEHPVKFPRLPIKQFWHERFHDDPAGRWLRGVLVKLFSGYRDDA